MEQLADCVWNSGSLLQCGIMAYLLLTVLDKISSDEVQEPPTDRCLFQQTDLLVEDEEEAISEDAGRQS